MLVKISEVREDSGWTRPAPLGLMAPDPTLASFLVPDPIPRVYGVVDSHFYAWGWQA